MKSIRITGIVLMFLGILLTVFSCGFLPKTIRNQEMEKYDKYYEMIKESIEYTETETEFVCNKVIKKIDVNANDTFVNYSFHNDKYLPQTIYYENDVIYQKNNLYDAVLYTFRCPLISDCYQVNSILVVGKGTTSVDNKVFDFNRTVDECVSEFTEHKINLIVENTINNYFGLSLLATFLFKFRQNHGFPIRSIVNMANEVRSPVSLVDVGEWSGLPLDHFLFKQ